MYFGDDFILYQKILHNQSIFVLFVFTFGKEEEKKNNQTRHFIQPDYKILIFITQFLSH